MLKGNFLTGALIPTQSTVDHIVAELFFVSLLLPSMVVVAAIAIPIAGAMLLAIHRFWLKKKITILRKEWKSLIIIAALFAATEFAWFDAVGRIGGSMTALLSVPLEPVAIIIMSFFILNEKLRKPQIIGTCVVIFGIILSLDMVGAVSMYQFGIGEIEAMMAAFTGATEVVLTVKFLSKYDENRMLSFHSYNDWGNADGSNSGKSIDADGCTCYYRLVLACSVSICTDVLLLGILSRFDENWGIVHIDFIHWFNYVNTRATSNNGLLWSLNDTTRKYDLCCNGQHSLDRRHLYCILQRYRQGQSRI